MSNFDKAWGKNVEEESADEFLSRQGYESLFTWVVVVAGKESDRPSAHFYEAMVGDGNLVRVQPKVSEDLLRTSKRLFGIDHPFLAVELVHKTPERSRASEVFDISLEPECLSGKSPCERVEELPSEYFGKNAHRDKEVVS